MTSWSDRLAADPLPWLLEEDTPAVRAAALRHLLDRPPDDQEVRETTAKAMASGPIAAILDAMHPDGYWVKPGAGYAPKYMGSVWQMIFLDQMGADGADPRVSLACEYLLSHVVAPSGGFGASGVLKAAPASSAVLHCLNGNLLRAFIGFGLFEDARVQGAIEWEARAITGDGFERYYQSGTSGPGFCCAANDKQPCAWGAIKAMMALARVPGERRSARVQAAIDRGVAFLLGRDPVVADYPFPTIYGVTKPSGSWFKLGFPIAYVTDVLQNLEALCELGHGRDPRLVPAVNWLLSKSDDRGRWKNQYAYNGKTSVDIEPQGKPSKWVTLRACRVLKAVFGEDARAN